MVLLGLFRSLPVRSSNMSASKQTAIKDAVTKALIEVFMREELCSKELHIHGFLYIKADNCSTFITHLDDNVLSKRTTSPQDHGYNKFGNASEKQILPVHTVVCDENNSSLDSGLPVQYFYRGTNSDSHGNSMTKSTHGAPVNPNGQRKAKQATPSMFAGARSNKQSSSILSTLLTAGSAPVYNAHPRHGHPPSSVITTTEQQCNRNSNIIVDLDLNKRSDSPYFRQSVDCLLVANTAAANFSSALVPTNTPLHNTPIDLSSATSLIGQRGNAEEITNSSLLKPYSIISPDAPSLHDTMATVSTAEAATLGQSQITEDNSRWLTRSPAAALLPNDDATLVNSHSYETINVEPLHIHEPPNLEDNNRLHIEGSSHAKRSVDEDTETAGQPQTDSYNIDGHQPSTSDEPTTKRLRKNQSYQEITECLIPDDLHPNESYRTTDAIHDGNTHIPSIEPVPVHSDSFDHPHSASPPVQHNSEHSLSERQPPGDAQRHDFRPLESRSHSNSPHPGSYACDPQNDPIKDPHTENKDNHNSSSSKLHPQQAAFNNSEMPHDLHSEHTPPCESHSDHNMPHGTLSDRDRSHEPHPEHGINHSKHTETLHHHYYGDSSKEKPNTSSETNDSQPSWPHQHDKQTHETAESLLLISSRTHMHTHMHSHGAYTHSHEHSHEHVHMEVSHHDHDEPRLQTNSLPDGTLQTFRINDPGSVQVPSSTHCATEGVIRTVRSHTPMAISSDPLEQQTRPLEFHDYSTQPVSQTLSMDQNTVEPCITEDNPWLLHKKGAVQLQLLPKKQEEEIDSKEGISGCTEWVRRGRTRFTPQQRAVLEAEYVNDPFLSVSADRRLQLADQLELPEKSIQVWFQNQRRRRRPPQSDHIKITYEQQPQYETCALTKTKKHMSA